MPIMKCKLCGATLEIHENESTLECEYCGTLQTLPKSSDETVRNLFNRANNLRLKCEFDKAEQIYEKILNLDDSEAEAHWGIILCKYGIEYVEDPKTFKMIPTCHRTLFESITSDAEYLAAIEYADPLQKAIYEREAKAINDIQNGILNIVKNEEPFDVFICYKETDEDGKRTVDSAIANDIYYQLTEEGFKVFYAAITLEDKLGQEYEPHIFAALSSAKVMLVIGTKPEYFEAVWVKNEWSRFMKLIKTDRSKLLIPCFKDMDAYDLPDEFAHLQAQDMGKIGFINDVVRGIKKVVSPISVKKHEPEVSVPVTAAATLSPLLKRAYMFLEDGNFESADAYCEKVLDNDPECAEAYLAKMMAEFKICNREDISLCEEPIEENGNYKKALRFADKSFAEELKGYASAINERKEKERLQVVYNGYTAEIENCKTEEDYLDLANRFDKIGSFGDSEKMAALCREKAEEIKTERLNAIYQSGIEALNSAETEEDCQNASEIFRSISGFDNADNMASICIEKTEDLKKQRIYDSAKEKMAENKIEAFEAAIAIFLGISAFKDSEKQISVCKEEIEKIKTKKEERRIAGLDAEYEKYTAKMNFARTEADYKKTAELFGSISGFRDADEMASLCLEKAENAKKQAIYDSAKRKMYIGTVKSYEQAIEIFGTIHEFMDSEDQIEICKAKIKGEEQRGEDSVNARLAKKYEKYVAMMDSAKNEEQYKLISSYFRELSGYGDSNEMAELCFEKAEEPRKLKIYDSAKKEMTKNYITNFQKAAKLFESISGFLDADEMAKLCREKSKQIIILRKGK